MIDTEELRRLVKSYNHELYSVRKVARLRLDGMTLALAREVIALREQADAMAEAVTSLGYILSIRAKTDDAEAQSALTQSSKSLDDYFAYKEGRK